MNLTELKYKISHATGIPFAELPGNTNHDVITSARALLNIRKADADRRKKTTTELFADWFSGKTGQATPDEVAYNDVMAALDDLDREACQGD